MTPLLLLTSLAWASAPEGLAPEADAAAVEASLRSQGPPAVVPARPLDLDDARVLQLRPGVTVRWVAVPGVRRVEVAVRLGLGAMDLDGGLPGEASSLLGDLWATAAKGQPADRLVLALDQLDATLDASVGLRSADLYLSVPRTELDPALALMADVLHRPTLPGRELARRKRELAVYLELEAPNSPRDIAWWTERWAWFPSDHPRGARTDLDALRRTGRRPMKQRHARILAEAPVEVLVVGDVDPADLEAAVAGLVEGLGATGERTPTPTPPSPPTGTRVLAVDVPSADQAVLRMRLPAPEVGHPDAAAYDAAAYQLGGHFLSRLNANLREDKGYTYGAGGRRVAYLETGWWSFGTTVAEDNVAAALGEVDAELTRLAEGGLDAAEVAAFHTNVVADWNRTNRSAGSALSLWDDLVEDARTLQDAEADLAAWLAVTPAATAEVAARWFRPDDRVIVVVGDRSAIADQLDGMFDQVTWIDAEDAVLGRFPGTGEDG